MGNTTNIFQEIRDARGTFHVNMGTTKHREGMYITEAEDIKKRCQEYIKNLYQNKS